MGLIAGGVTAALVGALVWVSERRRQRAERRLLDRLREVEQLPHSEEEKQAA